MEIKVAIFFKVLVMLGTSSPKVAGLLEMTLYIAGKNITALSASNTMFCKCFCVHYGCKRVIHIRTLFVLEYVSLLNGRGTCSG